MNRQLLQEVKTYSNKPIRVTLHDGAWVSAISLVLTLIFLYFWYQITDTALDQQLYAMAVIQTVVCCMIGQLVCEYTGINNMIAQSSIKYSRGTTLFDGLEETMKRQWSRS